MSKQFSMRHADHWKVSFHLIFSSKGDVRLTRGQPALAGTERAMGIIAKIPHSLFRVPTLSARITLDDKAAPDMQIDISAAEQALSEALGARVEIMVAPKGAA